MILLIFTSLSEPRFSQDYQDSQDFIIENNLENPDNLIKIVVQDKSKYHTASK